MEDKTFVNKFIKLLDRGSHDLDDYYKNNDDEYEEDCNNDYQKSERFNSNAIMIKEELQNEDKKTSGPTTPVQSDIKLDEQPKLPKVASKNIETQTHSDDINNNNISIYQNMADNNKQKQTTIPQNVEVPISNQTQVSNQAQVSNEPEKIPEPEFLTYDHLLINLKLLGRLGKGEKLLNNFGSVDIDNRYLPTFRRWFTSDGRTNTYEMLRKIVDSADYHSELLIKELKDENCTNNADTKHKLDVLTEDVISARTGFRNLIITYWDDESFLSKLDLCVDSLSVRKSKNLNFR